MIRIDSSIGSIAVINTFSIAVDGANSVILVLEANQSNDSRLSEPAPTCSTGINIFVSIAGNFMLYDSVAVIICV